MDHETRLNAWTQDWDPVTLDDTNERILRIVAERAGASVRTIASRVGSTHGEVRRRLAVLETRGIVVGNQDVVDTAMFGHPLQPLSRTATS